MRYLIILFLFIFQFASADTLTISENGITGVDLCYSTRTDAIALFGPGHTDLNNDLDSTFPAVLIVHGLDERLPLYYKSKGIIFEFDENYMNKFYHGSEVIDKIVLVPGFKGAMLNGLNIIPDSTTLQELFQAVPGIKLLNQDSTVDNVWRFCYGQLEFYVEGRAEHKHSAYKWNYDDYKSAKVKYVEVRRYCAKKYEYSGDTLIMHPLYAPLSEKHLNKAFITIDFLYAEVDSLEIGIWKYYHPNHVLKEEGEYRAGKKVGEWKYYDRSGKLLRSEVYDRPVNGWILLIIAVAGCAGVFFLADRLLKKRFIR